MSFFPFFSCIALYFISLVSEGWWAADPKSLILILTRILNLIKPLPKPLTLKPFRGVGKKFPLTNPC